MPVQLRPSPKPPSSAALLVLAGILAVGCHRPSSGEGGNHALFFDGQDDVMRLDSLAGTEGDGLTLEAWIRLAPGQSPKPNIMARRLPEGGQDTFLFRVRADQANVLEFGISSEEGEWGVASRQGVPLDQWVHVAVTHDRRGGLVVLYLDGEPAVEAPCPFSVGRGELPLWLGGDPSQRIDARAFSGTLDEIRVWSRVRGQEEIQATMKTHLRGDEPGLALYWTLDEGAGQRVSDRSGHAAKAVLGLRSGGDDSDPRWVDDVPFP